MTISFKLDFEIAEIAEAGIVAVSKEQPLNASLPMLVTLSGIVMFMIPLQPENAEP